MQHREAGSEATLVITAAAVALHFPVPEDPGPLIERFLGDLDLVLIEGWKERPGTKIEVVPADRKGHPREPVHAGLLAVVSSPGLRERVDGGFLWDEVDRVADVIWEWYRR